MRYTLASCFLIFLLIVFFASFSWSNHSVGEPQLEKLPTWNTCCKDADCLPQQVKILGKQGGRKISVEINGISTWVSGGKFFPVPSEHTWVCYFNPKGEVTDRNIRCILYPEKGGTVQIPSSLRFG